MITDILQWGADRLKAIQTKQLAGKRYEIEEAGFNYHKMLHDLETRAEGIVGANGHYRLIIAVDKNLRFTDMKNLRNKPGVNARIYNRPTWNILLGKGDSVKTRIREEMMAEIEKSFTQTNNQV